MQTFREQRRVSRRFWPRLVAPPPRRGSGDRSDERPLEMTVRAFDGAGLLRQAGHARGRRCARRLHAVVADQLLVAALAIEIADCRRWAAHPSSTAPTSCRPQPARQTSSKAKGGAPVGAPLSVGRAHLLGCAPFTVVAFCCFASRSQSSPACKPEGTGTTPPNHAVLDRTRRIAFVGSVKRLRAQRKAHEP